MVVGILGCLLVIVFVYWHYFFINAGRVRVANQSSQTVVRGHVQVCDRQFKFGTIAPGKSVAFRYRITSDSGYMVAVKLASGKELNAEAGYVTGGCHESDTLTITNSGIALSQTMCTLPFICGLSAMATKFGLG